MSGQQKRFTARKGGAVALYRELMTGDASLLHFLGFEAYTTLISGLAGALGLGLRSLFLPFFLRSCGKGVMVGKGVTIRQPNAIRVGSKVIVDDFAVIDVRSSEQYGEGSVTIEDHAVVGRGSLIVSKGGHVRLRRASNISSSCRIATQSSVDIGESALIAAYCYIGPGNHRPADDGKSLIEQEMDVRGGVVIGEHAWIGAHTTILDGVKIGKHATIGANSLVREDVPDYGVAAGSPAKLLKERREQQ